MFVKREVFDFGQVGQKVFYLDTISRGCGIKDYFLKLALRDTTKNIVSLRGGKEVPEDVERLINDANKYIKEFKSLKQ